jgi:hypothetical protein
LQYVQPGCAIDPFAFKTKIRNETAHMSFDVSAMGVDGVKNYKLRAAQCFMLAKRAPAREAKLGLLDMARAWLLLADQSQKNDQTVLMIPDRLDPRDSRTAIESLIGHRN